MVNASIQTSGPDLQALHAIARLRFAQDPSKCYQRHIREVHSEIEGREQLPSLSGAVVERISREDAELIILKYEWLAADPRKKCPMGAGVQACYGLKLNGELLGAVIFGTMGGNIRLICGEEYAGRTVCLMRGACVPHAPKNAASFLIRHACRLAFEDFGWCIFFAYSDPDAGEIGTVYQASNWFYIGEGCGRPCGSYHADYESPDKETIVSSYKLNHDKERKFMRSLGWSKEKGPMRPYLESLGWRPIKSLGKKKWVWFEGDRKGTRELKQRCRYPFLPYPKRVCGGSDQGEHPETIGKGVVRIHTTAPISRGT